MKFDKLAYGKSIEDLACEFLRDDSRAIIARNYRWKGGEIDIICEERRADARTELVFVEVRARRSGSWTDGLESVTYPKQLRLARTIRKYLCTYRGRAHYVRVDVLAWNGEKFIHYRDLRIAGAG